jgi:hypothetical protein
MHVKDYIDRIAICLGYAISFRETVEKMERTNTDNGIIEAVRTNSIYYVTKAAKAFYELHGTDDRDMRKVLPSWAVDPWREAIHAETRASGDQPTVVHTGP